MPPDAVPFSIWGWKLSEAAKFKNATKELVKHNICNLIRNFQVMKDDDTRMMIKMFMEAGIWGLGLHGLQAVWNILGTLPELTPETEAFAILEGIKAVGENVIKFAIRASIVAVLAPLFTQDKGNAAAVMVIMNDSDEDMQMSHFSITYGKVVGTFKEQLSSDNPQPIIPKRMPAIVNSKTGKTIVQGSIQACLFAARKRNQALTGSQGALEFEPTQIFPMGLFVGWEVRVQGMDENMDEKILARCKTYCIILIHITSYYIAFHYIPLHRIALHCITLHYITFDQYLTLFV